MIPPLNQRVRGRLTGRIATVVDLSKAPDLIGVRWDGEDLTRFLVPSAFDWIDWNAPLELDDGTPVEFVQYNGMHHARVRLPRPHSCQPSRSVLVDANAFDGLVISNHKYHVRNRVMPDTLKILEPLEVVTPSGTVTPVDYITTNLIGDIVVMPTDPNALALRWASFTKAGNFVLSSDGSGKRLTLRNRPKVETTEVDIALPAGIAKVRITTTDGSPTKVELV